MKFAQITFIFSTLIVLLIRQASYAQVDKCMHSPGIDYSIMLDTAFGTIRQSQHKIQVNPRDFRAYIELANSLRSICQYNESLKKYNQVIEQAEDKQLIAEAYIGSGYVLWMENKPEDALVVFKKAIQSVNDQGELAANAYNAIGQVLESLNKIEDAESAYRKSISLRNPPGRWNSMELVFLLQRQNRLEEVLSIFQKQLQRTPNDPEVINDLGMLLLKMEKYSDAESFYRNQIKNSPSTFDNSRSMMDNYVGLGYALIKQGKRTAAIEAYQKAIEIFQPGQGTDVCGSDINHFPFPNLISEHLVEQGLYDLAIALCRKEETGFPEGASHSNYIGEILLRQGKLNEALEAFKKAVRLSPDDKKAWENLAKTERLLKER
jgi:tetratricopeptide (TPR) repeat protein